MRFLTRTASIAIVTLLLSSQGSARAGRHRRPTRRSRMRHSNMGSRRSRSSKRPTKPARNRGPGRPGHRHTAPDAGWLVKTAETAVDRGNMTRAIVLYRGAVALTGEDPKILYRLAEIYRMAGQFAEASDTFHRFLEVSKNPALKAKAKEAIAAMKNMPAPFVDSEIRASLRARPYGIKAFTLGRKAFKRRRYALAVRYFQAALMLDPTLIGVLRWLGQVFDKLKRSEQAQRYYVKYLRIMPAGRNADMVRKRLKDKALLGKVSMLASFPCEVWINRSLLPGKKTPIKNLLLPAGEYSVIFYNRKYHVGRKMRVRVERSKAVTVRFDFGVLRIKLKPWARVRVDGRDVGLWTEIGVPSRAKPYRVDMVSYDRKHTMTRIVTIPPGRTVTIDHWK